MLILEFVELLAVVAQLILISTTVEQILIELRFYRDSRSVEEAPQCKLPPPHNRRKNAN